MKILDEQKAVLIQNILDQLSVIQTELERVANSMEQQSFFDSQFFAALIGATSALSVFILNEWFKHRQEKRKRLIEYCDWLNKQLVFDDPTGLFDMAGSTSYAGEDKPVGEKMVIRLQTHTKYHRKTWGKLRRLFENYVKAMSSLNQYSRKEDVPIDTMRKLESLYQKIQDFAFDVTGENKWTS